VAIGPSVALALALLLGGGCDKEADPPCEPGPPIELGYFHGGRAQLLYRAHLAGDFASHCLDLRLVAGRDAAGDLYRVPAEHQTFQAALDSKSVARWSSASIVQAIADGELDGGAVGEAELIAAVSRGLPITAVATLGINRAETPGFALLLRTGTELERAADLSALRIGVHSSAPFDLVLARELVRKLTTRGRAPTLIEMESPRRITEALRSGELNGAFCHYRAAKELVEASVATLHRRLDWVDAGLSHALLVFHNTFLDRRARDLERLLAAYQERIHQEAELPPEERRRMRGEGPTIADDSAELGLGIPVWEPHPRVDAARLEQVQELMVANGLLADRSDLYPHIDNRFLDRAHEPRRLIVVQWEGAEAAAVGEMLSDWELPNLRRLGERGATCELPSPTAMSPGARWRKALSRVGREPLELRAGEGSPGNRALTARLVDHLASAETQARTIVLRYHATGRAAIAACDAELRTLDKTLEVLGLSGETLVYLLAGGEEAGAGKGFLATDDSAVPPGAAGAEELEATLLRRAGLVVPGPTLLPQIADTRGHAAGDDPNIIVIALDAFRADHLGCLGYGRDTTPQLDALAQRGFLFTQAISAAGYTVPSTVSLLTGRHPPSHGVPFATLKLPPSALTLAEVLRDHGYATTAITGSVHNSSMVGYAQGFDRYLSEMEYGHLREVLTRARRRLNQHPGGPFFLYLHAYDAHAPYEVPEPFASKFGGDYQGVLADLTLGHPVGGELRGSTLISESGARRELSARDRRFWIDRYDAALAHADHQIGAFLRYLESTSLADNTILVVLGNHGESLFDHGAVLQRRHGDIWEEGIHVPLIVRIPEQLLAGRGIKDSSVRAIDTQAQLVDLMPTLLELLEIPIPEACQGRSLVPLMRGDAPADFNEYVYSIGSAGGNKFPWRSCVRTEEWKLLRFHQDEAPNPRSRLYRLSDDPGERRDLAADHPQIVARLGEKLDAYDRLLPQASREAMVARRKRWRSARGASAAVRPNVLLIIVDTLRADRLGCYGHDRPTTPNIDALAASGVIFESAWAQSCWTLPSFASLLSGQYPTTLGLMREEGRVSDFPYVDPVMDAQVTTLAEALSADGYATAAFFTGRFNDSLYGIDQGFELYRNYKRNIDKNRLPMRSFPDFLPEAFEFMEASDPRPFFVAMNPSEPHRPYLAPEIYMQPFTEGYQGAFEGLWIAKPILFGIDRDEGGWGLSLADGPKGGRWPPDLERPFGGRQQVTLEQSDIDYLGDRYDACLSYADRFIGEIVDRIQKEMLYETIIILTSDHGEGLGDHGVFLHATRPPRLYEEITHVPLIIKPAKTWLLPERRTIDTPVELVDLAPTVLELVGCPPLPGVQGRSLVGAMRGDQALDPERPVFAETRGYGSTVRSVRQGDWKLILTLAEGATEPGVELFDLASDPGETRNLATAEPRRVARLTRLVREWAGENAWLQALGGAP